MKNSTFKIGAILRGSALVAVLGLGAIAANAQTFLYEGVVYKATGNKLEAQPATTKPDNGEAPGEYKGDIVVPSELTYDGKDYVVTSIKGVFKNQPITSIVIGDGVATISRGCFQDCVELVSVVLPSDLATMQGDLFNGCVKLEELTIPGTVKEISSNQLKNCSSLKKLVIADGPTAIEISAGMYGTYEAGKGGGLQSMTSLTDVVINRAIGTKFTAMDTKPFRSSATITNVTLGGSLTEVPTSYFENCTALKDVKFEGNVTSLGTNVFTNTGIQEITLPSSITVIPNSTFQNCKSLKKVVLADEVTSIQATAFANSKLEEFKFPSNLQSIGELAFSGTNLSGEITFPPSFKSLGLQAFANNSGITGVNFGANVATISEGAFMGCNIAKYTVAGDNSVFGTVEDGAVLTSKEGKNILAVAPASTLAALSGDFTSISAYGAYNAKGIKSVSLANCAEWGDYAVSGTSIETLAVQGVIGRYVAANCPELKEITIVGKEVPFGIAANDAALTKVNLDEKLTVVKQDAFNGATALESLNLGSILAILEADAFKDSGIKELTVTAANPAGMAEGVFTAESGITVKVPVNYVDTYKAAAGWGLLNIVGDATLAEGPSDMGMPDGLYYAGTDGKLHVAYEDGTADEYDVGGVPHTFQLAQFKNRIYGASAGQTFVYQDPATTQGDGKLFYISKVGGETFQAVVLDNTGYHAFKDPFGLYVYGDTLFVSDRNVAVRKISADAIALPGDYISWVENQWLGFYGSPWSWGCIKCGWAITQGADKDGNPEPVYWVGMKYNGNGLYRFRNKDVPQPKKDKDGKYVHNSSSPYLYDCDTVYAKPENGVFLNSLNPIFTTFNIDDKNGHLYLYIEKAGSGEKLVKGGLYRVNLADLEANPDPSDFSTLNPVLIDGAPVKYEGSSTNEHVGISQLTIDEKGQYMYWCYRAATEADVAAVESETAGRYDWAEALDTNNPLHKTGIKRIKLGEAQPTVEMVVEGAEGYGVVPVNFMSSADDGVKDVVVSKENGLVYAGGALSVKEDATVYVYNMAGVIVATANLQAGESMSVDSLEAGVYVAAAGNSVVKFVK